MAVGQVTILDRFKKIAEIERTKFERKGPVNTVIAIALLLAFVYVPTTIVKDYWP